MAGVLKEDFSVAFVKILPGYYFGELDLLYNDDVRKYSFKALKDSELLVLNKKDFRKIIFSDFREIGDMMCINSALRKKHYKALYKEALKFSQETKNNSKEEEQREKEKNMMRYSKKVEVETAGNLDISRNYAAGINDIEEIQEAFNESKSFSGNEMEYEDFPKNGGMLKERSKSFLDDFPVFDDEKMNSSLTMTPKGPKFIGKMSLRKGNTEPSEKEVELFWENQI